VYERENKYILENKKKYFSKLVKHKIKEYFFKQSKKHLEEVDKKLILS
jgi:hypothetical protein